MVAHVDKETCIGCGLCPDTCPEIFEMQDDGKAEAMEDDISEILLDAARDAEDGCPVNAITIE